MVAADGIWYCARTESLTRRKGDEEMHKGTRSWGRSSITLLLVTAIVLSIPAPAIADGGIILSNSELWTQLEEGQQIAVVKLDTGSTAHVDLFISMLDNSGESHEVVFFLPLGHSPSEFSVEEKTSLDFDEQLTAELDELLATETRRVRSYRKAVQASLLLGTLFINGGWSWPVWMAVLLGGCTPAGAPAPLATFETESSQVAIYGVEGDTDLQALIETTGLDPSVKETLERQRGRQIAIVTLQTQPPIEEGSSHGREPVGQPGIHLAWTTQMSSDSEEASYAYPFGTGSAWAHPIEVTRVYVLAPPGVDFSVEYPELGPNVSGFVGGFFLGPARPRIAQAHGAAHAVENVVGDFGRVWRVTYLESNSAEDVIITRVAETTPATRAALRVKRNSETVLLVTWMIALLVAFGLWLTAWRYIMPRFLGTKYRWLELKLWRDALLCAILTPFTNPVAVLGALILALSTLSLSLEIGIMVLVVTLFALLTLLMFIHLFGRRAGVPDRRAALGYIVVVVAVNAVYLPFAVGYAALVGAL